MNQIDVAPEVLKRFHELAAATHRSDAEIIGEALNGYLEADRHFVAILEERIAAADSGELASDETVAEFFANHAE